MHSARPGTTGRVIILPVAILLIGSLIVIGARAGTVIGGPAGPTFKGDPQAVSEVQAAYAKYGTARSYRMRMAAQGQVIGIEFVVPDRYRFAFGSGAEAIEITNIGTDQWVKSGTTCQKSPARVPTANPRQYMEHGNDSTITVTKGGRETVEDTATQTYGLVIVSSTGTVQQKLYVAVATGYPRRTENQSSQGSATIDYFDFNGAIKIDPPC